jgi:Ca2+-binding RTX toxin-like protein
MPTYTNTITGTSGDDQISGTSGNDYITSTGGHDMANGGAGDDYLYFRGDGGEISGGVGNDILDAGQSAANALSTVHQAYHFYAGPGDDLMRMDLTNKEAWGHQGFHSYGGIGNDTFSLLNVKAAEADMVIRLDDFNATRDQLVVEGQVIDLASVPAGMRVVSYLGQQWLHINNDTSVGNTDPLKGDIMVCLDGARQMPADEEVHFSPFPDDADALPAAAFTNDNYVPYDLYAAREATLKVIASGSSSVTGTEGADYIYGYKDQSLTGGMTSTVSALGGDDVVEAGSGHDTVNGGAGNDLLSGGLDKDILLGGTGNDLLLGGSEDDRLEGQSGNDTLKGGRGFDEAVFSGAKANYTITTSGGVTTVVDTRTGTPDGTDTVSGVERLVFADQVVDLGGTGTPSPIALVGGSGNDTLNGGAGVDEIYGRNGFDALNGMGGNDKLFGENGDDRLDGGAGDDAMVGGLGHDTYVVDSTGDTVTELAGTGTGLDSVRATLSSYSLGANVENLTYEGTGSFTGTGNALANIITGGAGNDLLDGGAGKDSLKGGAGADTLLGGAGVDTLDGGAGADDFVFTAATDSLPGALDTILGFVRGEDDIVVSAIDANASLAGDQAFVLDAGGTFSMGEVRQRVVNGNLFLDFNTDADTTAEMIVQIKGVASPLAASDFDF